MPTVQDETIKKLAHLFRECHKPYVYGGFALVKDRAIKEALAQDTLIVDSFDSPHVAMIAHKMRSASTRSDYTMRDITIAQNSMTITKLAVAKGHVTTATKMLETLCGKLTGWCEIFEEDARAQDAVHKAKFKYAYTKVTAGGDLMGIYMRPGTGGGFFSATLPRPLSEAERKNLVLVRKRFADPPALATIMAELNRHEDWWEQHYSVYNKRNSWTACALRGFDKDDIHFIAKPSEMAKSWKLANPERMIAPCVDTRAYECFPTVRKLLAKLPCEFERVRFMRLAAVNGELSRHADSTDKFAGIRDGMIARLHVPIVTNPETTYYAWSDRGEMMEEKFPAGSLFYLDARKPHRVVNKGTSDRIHLVADAICNPKLRTWMGFD